MMLFLLFLFFVLASFMSYFSIDCCSFLALAIAWRSLWAGYYCLAWKEKRHGDTLAGLKNGGLAGLAFCCIEMKVDR